MVNEPAPTPIPAPRKRLIGWLPMALGVLGVVVGALWTLQGLDILDGSRMSGVGIFAVIGPAIAVAGLISIILGVRARTRAKRAEATA
ncbi:MAG TPA: hypothetical protein VFG35_10625 [Actinoplanes sp.]|nr:hypothetical protein [Actinoplanes sp.]